MSSLAPQLTPEVTLDPYPFYASLRDAGPISFVPSLMRGCYVLTRHEDIASVLFPEPDRFDVTRETHQPAQAA